MGRIGREVAKWCRGFGMSTIGYDPVLSESQSRGYGIEPTDLSNLLKNSDFITIHTPLTKETKNLFNAETLGKKLKNKKIIIKFSFKKKNIL